MTTPAYAVHVFLAGWMGTFRQNLRPLILPTAYQRSDEDNSLRRDSVLRLLRTAFSRFTLFICIRAFVNQSVSQDLFVIPHSPSSLHSNTQPAFLMFNYSNIVANRTHSHFHWMTSPRFYRKPLPNEMIYWTPQGLCNGAPLSSSNVYLLPVSKQAMSSVEIHCGEGPPEAKRFRIDVPTQVEVDAATDVVCSVSTPLAGEASQEGQSPAAPSSASYRSSNGSVVSTDSPVKEEEIEQDEGPDSSECDILDMISKTMLSFAKVDDHLARPSQLLASLSTSPSPLPSAPSAPVLPGSVAVAQSPAAQLFAEDDWSWHRNPAAAIRSGGTNKQTPVWKYFVYNKAENLSRCIVGDCTYMLKGPHTSTLACHLKKHVKEYAEFQKLKADYSRTKIDVQGPPKTNSGEFREALPKSPITPTSEGGKPRVKKEPVAKIGDVSSLMNVFRTPPISATTPTMPTMPNLMQNLMMGAMNPLQMMLAQSLPTSSNSFTPAHAAALQQAVYGSAGGLAVNPGGQMMQSKKWRKDDRKQKELETKLALALYSSHVGFDVLHNPHWKELFEVAQPKFTVCEEVSIYEQIVSATCLRLQQSMRSMLHSAKRVSLLVDAVEIATPGFSEAATHKLVVAASIPVATGATHEIQTIFLAFRTVAPSDNLSESVGKAVEQVISDYGIVAESINRVVCSGIRNLIGEECGNVVDKQIESFASCLLSALNFWLENNSTVKSLHESVIAMLDSLFAETKNFPGNAKLESLPILLEAVVGMRDCLKLNNTDLTEQQWSRVYGLNSLCNVFKQYVSTTPGSDVTTIDSVLPTIQQILLTLEKDAYNLGELGLELRDIITERMAFVLDEECSEFDPTFVQATALNPQLAVILSPDQLACAKRTIEKELSKRAVSIKKERKLAIGVDAILANVMKNVSESNELTFYGDLFQNSQIKKEDDNANESIVNSYFEEISNSSPVESLFSPLVRTFGNPLQAPLAYWRSCSAKCPALSELAAELLSLPTCTLTVDRALSMHTSLSPYAKLDAAGRLLATSENVERQLLLRLNRNLVAKML
ncbi:unnamed protein product [Caenorhabditis auriculariae]|uniref:HAT C-terminal dimerisation domain-containing protein n=1 Tax=Caenorhabditis auriculariae TaxID=2777116 RepID=A0A8S1H4B0_9PELO|nr:unnamed protein product [Caenorhabditis auriculariae]